MHALTLCLIYMSLPAVQENANRLKAYKTNLVVFPRRSNKPKAGDSPAEQLQTVRTFILSIPSQEYCAESGHVVCGGVSIHWPSRRELHGLQGLEVGYAPPDSSGASL